MSVVPWIAAGGHSHKGGGYTGPRRPGDAVYKARVSRKKRAGRHRIRVSEGAGGVARGKEKYNGG